MPTYDEMTVAELRDELLRRDLPVSGTKPELVERLTAADAEQPAEDEDPRDATIARLQAELDAIKATPEGEREELRKAFDALAADVERMRTGQGLVPVPDTGEPDPYLYWARLATGRIIEVQHPNATHHHDDEYGLVPIEAVFAKAA